MAAIEIVARADQRVAIVQKPPRLAASLIRKLVVMSFDTQLAATATIEPYGLCEVENGVALPVYSHNSGMAYRGRVA